MRPARSSSTHSSRKNLRLPRLPARTAAAWEALATMAAQGAWAEVAALSAEEEALRATACAKEAKPVAPTGVSFSKPTTSSIAARATRCAPPATNVAVERARHAATMRIVQQPITSASKAPASSNALRQRSNAATRALYSRRTRSTAECVTTTVCPGIPASAASVNRDGRR